MEHVGYGECIGISIDDTTARTVWLPAILLLLGSPALLKQKLSSFIMAAPGTSLQLKIIL